MSRNNLAKYQTLIRNPWNSTAGKMFTLNSQN